MDDTLKHILATHPCIWRAGDRGSYYADGGRRTSLDTGYSSLNRQLHGAGWPQGVSNELYVQGQGIGELRLLLPALRSLAQEGYLCWIAPPHIPFAPALQRQGIDLQRLLIISVQSLPDRLWAAEQSLLSGCCAAVVSWFGDGRLGIRELRRLQLAAERSGGWSVLLRDSHCRKLPSPSAFRACLRPDQQGRLEIELLKQPGGWAGQQLTLSLAPHYEQWQRLPPVLLPAYNATPLPDIASGAPVSGIIASGNTAVATAGLAEVSSVVSKPAATIQQR